jgi:S1/P1 Nuclease
MSKRLRIAVLISCVFNLCLMSGAYAWNSSGHIIIALIAYDQLDPATRTKAVELLRAHPRFNDHFEGVMPREVKRGNDREKDEWVFAHAATWPDQVRDSKEGVNYQDVSQFSRPFWHYINEPVFLNESERQQLSGEIHGNLRRDPPQDSDDPNMNIVQALKNSAHIVGDATASRERRAVHLCWVLHLTGDAHQPLHSVALFTTHRFRGDDHGGNYLDMAHGWNLHGFWDEQISTDVSYETLRISAADLNQNAKLRAAGEQAAATLDPGKWIDESAALAKQYGYTQEVLKKVADREGHSHLGPLDLPASYKTMAEEVAEHRAVEAGCRLAAVIQQMLK